VTHYAIIGDGGAGRTAAFYIRQADPKARIEIYSDDPNAAYYRAALTNYLIGELREAQLFATPPDFYETNNIQRVLGRVAKLDAKNSRFTLDEGGEVSYDQLLIAAGASPNPPNFPGANLPGVMTMRTLQDARTVMDQISAKRLKQAVVVGGGPLGIEWVQGLLHHHVRVIYLLRGDVFFERALDRTASDLVISRLRSEGVDVRTNEEIGEALAGKDGRMRAVRLKNSGEEVECQLVGAAIGIRPNVAFLEGSGVDVAVDPKRGTPQGVKVNEAMRTNIPNVYAAGDIIHRTLGLWEPARLQGRVAGRNMAGGSDAYRQGVHYNATRLYDLDFAGVGELSEKPGDQVLIDFPKGSGRVAYRKLIIRNEKLVGAIMLGQRKERVRKYGMHFRRLIDEGIDISAVSKDLLDSSFDLASWMDSHEIGDQIEAARRIKDQPRAPSIADMRMTRNALSADFRKTSGISAMAETAEAALLFGGNRVALKSVTRIGRMPENDLVLGDPDVSGQHAQIRLDPSGFVLEDLKSRNGTYLNGARIAAPSRLASGALIKIGGTQIQFVAGAPAENLRMTSAGLPEAPAAPPALPSDPVWGYLQIDGRDISLQMTSPNIGRDAKADIVLNDPAISYIHAQLVRQGNDTYLRDLGSRNGTFVNGERISVPHRLEKGDVIKMGGTSLIYHLGSVPASKPKKETPAPVASASPKPEPVPPPAAPAPEPPSPPVPSPSLEEHPAAALETPAAAHAPLGISLTARSGKLSGRVFPLDQSPINVGRDPSSHIVVNDDTASWRHAMFKQEDMKWFVKDLGSSNGTFLNDKPLDANQLYRISPADRIRIGETILEVS
jgi:pSer/pThr/pTyr-binding forkhead associated (FHA) protein/NADPH-dependent 2,4-dienoyl-CoA reductase/sulfur reductase-like enzyme